MKSPGEIHSPGLIPATAQQPESGFPVACRLAGRRPIIRGRLIITLLLIRSLLRRLVSPLRLWLIRGLRLPVESSGHATSGTSEQAADSCTPPGVRVIDGGPQSGPQGRTQPRARVKVGGLTRCGASREKTQAQQTYQYPLLSQAQAPKALSWLHDSSLPNGLIGPFK